MIGNIYKLRSPLFILIWALMVTDIGLLFVNRNERERVFHGPNQVVANKDNVSFPDLVGYSASGKELTMLKEPSRMLVVRYAAKDCTYCGQDNARWITLASALRERGFQTATIDTAAHSAYPATSEALANGKQFTFVGLDWMSHLRLRKTPTLIMLGKDRSIIWAHEGVLTSEDCISAIKAAEL